MQTRIEVNMNNHSKLKQELQSLELKEKRFLNKKVVITSS